MRFLEASSSTSGSNGFSSITTTTTTTTTNTNSTATDTTAHSNMHFHAHDALELPIEDAERPSLDFLIIGAGIAGLSCAYALKRAGHKVRVLEAEETISKSHNGIRVPPNMSRVLNAWGLGAHLAERSGGRCPSMQFHQASTGEVCGELIYHEEVMRVLEAELYLAHHADLVQMLFDLVTEADIAVQFGSRVAAVRPNGPSVILASGEELHADIIVGADGDCSVARPELFSGRKEVEVDGNLTTYSFWIPKDQVANDEELLRLFEVPKACKTELSVCVYKKEIIRGGGKGWSHDVPVDKALPDGIELEPRLKRLLSLVDSAVQQRHVIQEKLENWYDDSGHVVLVGDAAHLMNPNNSDSAAMAVEDAVVLGSLFSKLKSRDHIKRYLGAYQEMRQQRCQEVSVWGASKVEFCTLPPGPRRDTRDDSMRMAMHRKQRDWTESDEDYLRESWEELKDVFGYNAFEEADTWWVEWGVMLERMEKKAGVGHVRGVVGEIVVEHGVGRVF